MVLIKTDVIWDVAEQRLVNDHRCFGGMQFIPLQGQAFQEEKSGAVAAGLGNETSDKGSDC